MNLETILILNDNKDNFSSLKQILENNYFILFTTSLKEAVLFIKERPSLVSAVCVSSELGAAAQSSSEQSACIDFLREVRKDALASHIPIIVSARQHSEKAEREAMENGAVDFIHEPFDAKIVLQRFKNVIRLRDNSLTVSTVTRDEITGLYTKSYFLMQAQQILENRGEKLYDFVCCDIERFKIVNDLCGSEVADKILKKIGEELQKEAHGYKGIAGHFSEDIFYELLERTPEAYTDSACAKFIEKINKIPEVRQFNLNLKMVFGIYHIHNMRVPLNVMCDRAKMAAEKVKGHYGIYSCIYDDSIRKKMLAEQQIASHMEDALTNNEFIVYYQPKYDLSTETVAGAEALVRWKSRDMGFMPPDNFIPLFERNGFITRMDMFIWEKVARDLHEWIQDGNEPVAVSINVSRADLLNPNLVQVLTGLVEKYDIPAKYLHLEITESAYTEDPEQIVKIIYELRKHEFMIEMDDFGSGYSSLNMLSEMPIDILKLDMSFVRNEMERTNGKGIINYIISLAKWLNLQVVAEGVETKQQITQLKEMGCDYVQGYYFSKPLERSEFFALLKKSNITDMNAVRTAGVENLTKPHFDGQIFDDAKNTNGVMLVVDDVESSRIILSEMFKKDFTIAQAANGVEAWKYIEANYDKISIVLLDLFMPVMNGYEVLKKIRADKRTKSLPVIVTSQGDNESEQKSLELNADDFLTKPYNANIMKHRVRNVVAHSMVQKLEEEKTLAKKLLDIERQAHSDFLTGLNNRTILEKSVDEFFVKSSTYDAVFISLDIDDFKTINDTFGHLTGDETIKKVADILSNFFDKKACICRMGGDEFAIFVPKKIARAELEKRLEELSAALRFDVEKFKVTCSIGVAVAPDFGMDYQTLYNNSDMALLAAKRYGKNQFNIFAGQSVLPSYVFYRNMDWLLDEFSDAVYVCYADSYDLIYVNKVACKICGKEKKNCIGQKCYKTLFNRDKPCEFCIKGENVYLDFVQKNIFPDEKQSTCYTMRAKIVNWSGFDARIQYMRESTLNTNLARTLENVQTLDDVGDVFVRTFDKLPTGICKFVADDEGEFTFKNNTLCEILGYDKDEFDAKFQNKFFKMIFEQDVARVRRKVLEQVKIDEAFVVTFRIETVDENLHLFGASGKVLVEDGRKFVYMNILSMDFVNQELSENDEN